MNSIHPIMVDYLKSNESLDKIVHRHFNKNQYLEVVWAQLVEEIHQKEINQVLLEDIDKAILSGHPDTNIYMLFISIAVSYNNTFLQFDKAHSLCSIALSLDQEKIQPVVRALFTQHYANLFRKEGNLNKCMRLMDESLAMVSEKDARYVVILNNTLFMVAIQGKLKENGVYKLDHIHWDSSDDQFLYPTELKIENAIVTGNYQEGFDLYDQYKNHLKEEPAPRFKEYRHMLKIISGDFNEANFPTEGFKNIARNLNFLALGKTEEAKKFFKNEIKEESKKTSFKITANYILLHIEINLGNKGMAKMILFEKEKKGDTSYIDDLFYGRLQLLNGDSKGADFYFSRLIENVKRYGAMNRLIFELQFAKEMKLSVVMQLINGWKSTASNLSIAQPKKEILISGLNDEGLNRIVGKSKAIMQVKEVIKKYAKLKAPILITGETGTGKELVSRAIHEEGDFPKEPFLAINCGALTDSLLQSELFGYEAGAFTGAQKQRKGIFEAAGKGTVFLDEFGDISSILQVSLLRVLESNEIRLIGSTANRKVECKIVVATNVDLQEAVAKKKFREDLFFRLAKFEINIPSLRERPEDLPVLIQYFLDKNSNTAGVKKVSPNLLNKFMGYHWPGNIRELKNEIDRLFILNPDVDVLDVEHFDFTHLQIPQNKSNAETSTATDVPLLKIIQKGFPVEARHNMIKDLFRKYKKLTRSQIMEIANISTTTATKDLLVLTEAGFIVRRTPTKSSRTDYFELKNSEQ